VDRFKRKFVLDSEYQRPDGETIRPVCLVMIEIHSQKVWEIFFDKPRPCPIKWRDDDLVIVYNGAADFGFFIAAGWPIPPNILDLYYEHLREMNGAKKTGRIADFTLLTSSVKLTAALRLIGRDDLIYHDKTGEQQYVMRWGVTPPPGVPLEAHRARIVNYCKTDVRATMALVVPFVSLIENFDQALLRGKFGVFVAYCEHNGIPLDGRLFEAVKKHRNPLILSLIEQTEKAQAYGFYKSGGVFSQAAFRAYITSNGWDDHWPRTQSGASSRKAEDLEDMAVGHPEVEPLRVLLKTINRLRRNKIRVGSDGRSRPSVWPFMQASGRCNPKGDCLLSQTSWFRNLMKPDAGWSIVAVDVAGEEYGLAGAVSGDRRMIETYAQKGDQYMSVAIQAGAAPPGATKHTHEEIRNTFKIVSLSTLYGVQGVTLSNRLKLGSPYLAELMIGNHHAAYPTYWAWAEERIAQAYRDGFIESPLGWRLWVGTPMQTKRNSLLNFPVQSARGLAPYVIYPHHDAIYCHCPSDMAKHVGEVLVACFRDAGKFVCGDWFELRCDDPHIVNYPDRYDEPKGIEMWTQVLKFLEEVVGNSDLTLAAHNTLDTSH
jgi:DNA polymerase family A